MRQWMKIGLLASVAGNLFLGGLLIGSEVRRGPGPPFGPPSAEMIEKLASHLPAEDRALLQAEMGDMKSRFKASFEATESAKAAAAAALSQEPFDAEKFRSAVLQIDGQMQQISAEITKGLLGTAGKLSPQGRAFIADLMRKAPAPGMMPPK